MSKFIKHIVCPVTIVMLAGSAMADKGGTGADNKSMSPTTVVELFTSQGCSSCPPANEFVGSLIEDDDKLVLSYGVTYWDYLGWKDTFGHPEFTKRQKAYEAAMDIGFVYTPQIVLNGQAHNSRYTSEDVNGQNPLRVGDLELEFSEMNGELYVNANTTKLALVTFTPGWQEVAVKRGENHGRTLKIANVVDHVRWIEPGKSSGVRAEPGKAYAVLLHDENFKIIAARVLNFTSGE